MSPRVLLLVCELRVAVPSWLDRAIRESGAELHVLAPADLQAADMAAFALQESTPAAETALALAVAAYQRARQEHPATMDENIGLGFHHGPVAASGGPARIECCLAVQSKNATGLISLVLDVESAGQHSVGEVARELLVRTAADACSLDVDSSKSIISSLQPSTNHIRVPEALVDVWHGDQVLVWARPDGSLQTIPADRPAGILSGAFNPLHAGHVALRDAAQHWLQGPVAFELPLWNAEKPALDYLTLHNRLGQFPTAPVALSGAPTFAEKSAVFPGTTFVVGIDTAARVIQPRFYSGRDSLMRDALLRLREAGCRFLVAGRKLMHQFQTLDHLPVPDEFADLFIGLPAEAFRMDISSSEQRRQRNS